MLTEMPEVEWNRYMRSHNSVNIHGEFAYLSGRTKSHFLKTEIYFTTIIRTYWATKYESRRENEFWATCHNISNLCDGC